MNCHAVEQVVVVAEHGVLVYETERADVVVVAELCLGMNVC